MRTLPQNLAGVLASGLSTHCHCWLLSRQDGETLGFTDHDRDLMIGATLFEAASGVAASAVESETGLASNGGEIGGAITSARITAEDIEAGRYDGAIVQRWLVDWQEPALNYLLDTAILGAIRRKDGAFVAETRNSLHALDAERGRVYAMQCSAELGDAACGVSLSAGPFRVQTAIVQTDGRSELAAPAFKTAIAGLLARGRLTVISGANAGVAMPIRQHEGNIIRLWQAMPGPLRPGDLVAATAGCDKRFATCRDRFANALNFRGFPMMPAPEFTFSYARDGEGSQQGRPLVQL
ncbi:COG5449 Uncharacterized conserved protein [Rhabdaerophilaceae bacterium]